MSLIPTEVQVPKEKLTKHFTLSLFVPSEKQAKRAIKACAIQSRIYGNVIRTNNEMETYLLVRCFSHSMNKLKDFLDLLSCTWMSEYPIEFSSVSGVYDHKFTISKSEYKKQLNCEESIDIQSEMGKQQDNIHESWSCILKLISDYEQIEQYPSDESTEYDRICRKEKSIVRQKKKLTQLELPKLQRVSCKLIINNMELDLSNPKSWSCNQIRILLTDTSFGIGLVEEQLKGKMIYGNDLENVVDALIRFNGDKEAKIEHACKKLDLTMSIKKSIVRWSFKNLLK